MNESLFLSCWFLVWIIGYGIFIGICIKEGGYFDLDGAVAIAFFWAILSAVIVFLGWGLVASVKTIWHAIF